MSTDAAASNLPDDDGMSVEDRRRSALRTHRITGILVAVLFAILIFAAIAIPFKLHISRHSHPVKPPQLEPSKEEKDQSRDSSADAAFHDVEIELLRLKFEIELAHTKQAVRHSEDVHSEWTALVEETLHDEAGKKIGADEFAVVEFLALRDLPAPEQLEWDFQSGLAALEQEGRTSSDGSSLSRSTDAIAALKRKAFTVLDFQRARVEALNELRLAVIGQAPGNTFHLDTILAKRSADLGNARTSAAKTAAERLKREMNTKLKELTQKRDILVTDVSDLKEQLARIERGESAKPVAHSTETSPQASREEFRRELDQIRTVLKPFITPGYVQPESADKLVYQKVKSRFSYLTLKRVGALKDSEQGWSILFRLGGSKSATQQNDRPIGTFPRMNSLQELHNPNSDVLPRVKEAQRLLRLYGPLMVEEGLLSP